MASKEYRIIGNMYHHQVTRNNHAPLSATTYYHHQLTAAGVRSCPCQPVHHQSHHLSLFSPAPCHAQVDHGKHGGSGGKLRKALDALDPALRRALGLREEEAPAQWTQDNYYVRQVATTTTARSLRCRSEPVT
jgi:hypothetical protein